MPYRSMVDDVDATLEDLTFLADTHCSLEEAAKRLGIKSNTLDNWLRRRGETALLARFLRPADQPAPPRTTRPPTRTALSEELRKGARPLPAVPRMSAPHRPWCVDCKVKHEATDLDRDGRCDRCAKAAVCRAAAAERRAHAEAERKAAEQAERRRQARSTRPTNSRKAGNQGTSGTRSSAPRATASSSKPGRTPGAGSAVHREKNPPATREKRPAVAGGPRPTTDTTRIRLLYVEELRSIPEIAAITGHARGTVRAVLIGAQIQLRDDRRTKSGGKPTHDGPELTEAVRRAYVDEGLSLIETGARFRIAQQRVKRMLEAADVEIRPHAFSADYERRDQAKPLKQRIAELGVPTRQIKEWAVRVGLLNDVRVGLPSAAIVEAYAAAQAVDVDLVSFAMGAPTAVVRIWAAKNGRSTPSRGPVNRMLRMAYAEAMFALSEAAVS